MNELDGETPESSDPRATSASEIPFFPCCLSFFLKILKMPFFAFLVDDSPPDSSPVSGVVRPPEFLRNLDPSKVALSTEVFVLPANENKG